MNTRHFGELRQRLADCRAAHRTAKDLHEQVQVQAEQAAIDAGKAGGKNAEERARSLALALMNDASYQSALARLRRAEHEAECVEALLEAARDERRAAEWQIRAKLADGLFRVGMPHEDDTGYDDVADAEMDVYTDAAARDNNAPPLLIANGHNALDEEDFPF